MSVVGIYRNEFCSNIFYTNNIDFVCTIKLGGNISWRKYSVFYLNNIYDIDFVV
jgi:hypothetical protein